MKTHPLVRFAKRNGLKIRTDVWCGNIFEVRLIDKNGKPAVADGSAIYGHGSNRSVAMMLLWSRIRNRRVTWTVGRVAR